MREFSERLLELPLWKTPRALSAHCLFLFDTEEHVAELLFVEPALLLPDRLTDALYSVGKTKLLMPMTL